MCDDWSGPHPIRFSELGFSELGFDGPITGTAAITLALVIASLMTLVLWMERRVVGRAWAILFGLLRFTALAGVCWMLLQPCLVTRQTSVRNP